MTMFRFLLVSLFLMISISALADTYLIQDYGTASNGTNWDAHVADMNNTGYMQTSLTASNSIQINSNMFIVVNWGPNPQYLWNLGLGNAPNAAPINHRIKLACVSTGNTNPYFSPHYVFSGACYQGSGNSTTATGFYVYMQLNSNALSLHWGEVVNGVYTDAGSKDLGYGLSNTVYDVWVAVNSNSAAVYSTNVIGSGATTCAVTDWDTSKYSTNTLTFYHGLSDTANMAFDSLVVSKGDAYPTNTPTYTPTWTLTPTPTRTPTPFPTAYIAVPSDLHHKTSTDDQTSVLRDAYDIFIANAIKAVLFMGDMFDSNIDRADNQTQLTEINGAIDDGIPTFWVLGNHDAQNVGATFLTDRPVYAPNILKGDEANAFIDAGAWRIIYINAIEDPRFTASSGTLTWLETALSDAKTAGKYIAVASHPLIWLDWPGCSSLSDSNWTVAPTTKNANNVTVTGNISPAATSGAIGITSTASDFVAGDVGRIIIAKGTGGAWGVATITGVESATLISATVIMDHEFPDTNSVSSGNWGFGTASTAYSVYSFNSKAIRSKIETAKTGGAEVKLVIHGHGHTRVTATVSDIAYQEFPTMHDGGDLYGLLLEPDGSFSVNGPLVEATSTPTATPIWSPTGTSTATPTRTITMTPVPFVMPTPVSARKKKMSLRNVMDLLGVK